MHVPSQDKGLSTATIIKVHVPSQDKGLSTATVIEVHVPSQDKGLSTVTVIEVHVPSQDKGLWCICMLSIIDFLLFLFIRFFHRCIFCIFHLIYLGNWWHFDVLACKEDYKKGYRDTGSRAQVHYKGHEWRKRRSPRRNSPKWRIRLLQHCTIQWRKIKRDSKM